MHDAAPAALCAAIIGKAGTPPTRLGWVDVWLAADGRGRMTRAGQAGHPAPATPACPLEAQPIHVLGSAGWEHQLGVCVYQSGRAQFGERVGHREF